MSSPNPALGAHLQPFSGITTFMRQPASRDLHGVDVAIVGIPFDSGTSYRSGTRFGPRKIREASLMLWGHHPILNVSPLEKLTLVDYGDVEVIPVDIRATMENVTREVGEILAQNVSVISLGGDHSLALPLLRAHAAKHGPLAVVHFDSHPDMWNREFGEAFPYSHGTPFIRAVEEGLIDREAYLQIGIRGPVSGPEDYADATRLGAEMITIGRAFEMGVPAIIERIHAKMGSRNVYVTLDIDATDPAYAPGTGTPEVGGFTSFQMLQMVRGLKGLNLVGFDLVEVNPQYDHGDITAILAANLVFEFLSLLAV
ncbi:MAG: agmatinase [Anaerolineales bacterium]